MLSVGAEKRLLGKIERVLLQDSADRNALRDTAHLHPSEMAKENWCPRQSYYKMTDVEVSDPESFSFQRLNIFEEGHYIHAKWQHWMKQTGILIGDWKCNRCGHRWWAKSPDRCPDCFEMDMRYAEVPLNNDEHHILGNADGMIEDEQGIALVELKGLALSTPLPTPKGWTTMGDVRVGDLLFGSDGGVCRVTRKSPVRTVPGYRVLFDDGSSIECDEDHLWPVLSGVGRNLKHKVLPAKEIAATLWKEKSGVSLPQRQHRVLLAQPLLLPDSTDLPVHPYTLGVWLGDGHFAAGSAHLTGSEETFDQLRSIGQSLGNPHQQAGCFKVTLHGVAAGLKKLNLAGVRSPHRWIPEEYLRSGYNQRLAILQGLMDADGTWAKGRNRAVFGAVASKALALGVYELVASLGLRPRITEHTAYGYGKTIQAWYVEFTPNGVVPFRMPSKVSRAQGGSATRTLSGRRLIKGMIKINRIETQCVQVDSVDHTYLCGQQMVPTHNSVGLGTIRFDAPALYKAYADGEIKLDELWKRVKKPLAAHNRQIQLYMYCKSIDAAVVIYEWKPTQEVKEFALKYDHSIVAPLLKGAKEIIEAVKDDMPPVKPASATSKSCKTCQFCPYKTKCWTSNV